ncbi:ABC-F family ATP-binding cassette domain-containing protein [Roseisolibacter sp. H3M3-2]|uniref:ABC-F family ATP-binding cassette domain-containing protein n=1 Tax=Roseisolibacter sp. H3M3-2 TaxID=3031323 RepID=UPI0023DAA875|nr:ABC-F family ATP-binding cassette domain-containing protein [Roseisolibacter sp. H3M3-2]MDF1504446.1 ABC-F family ATP-binding cassette domain-containing protein [Roseisolibacter sp. H3M3-2]
MTQLAVSNVAVEFGATTLFQDVTFTVAAGERWGIVGRNGSGKTTLFRLLTGQLAPTRGQIARQPGLTVTLLEQHRDFGDAETVWDGVAGAFAGLRALERRLAEQAAALETSHDEAALERYGHDLERFEREGGYSYHARVDQVLEGLGFDAEASKTRMLKTLSGGERGRVGLARQLVLPGDVLLLDEPTNHLDLETTRWLEAYLQGVDRTVILVSHDRAFLAAVVDHVLHVEGGSMFPYVGGYEAFVAQRTERRLAQQRQFDKQQKTIAAQEDYIRRNLAGQNTKQAKGRRKLLARLPRLSAPLGGEDVMALRLESGARGGDQVLVAEKATLGVPLGAPRSALAPADGHASVERRASSVEGHRVLIRDFTTRLTRGEVVGFIGPNGAGKSTLLKAIVGDRSALLGGSLRVGDSIAVAHYRQDLAQVPFGRTLYDVIQDLRPTWERRLVQGHLGRFGFSGDEVQRRAETLSGGERARVALAMMMLQRANLLILDEPTNHLDVESIEALEDALDGFDGTVLLVSHDRALLRALATQVWALHDGRVHAFEQPFAEWEAEGGEALLSTAAARSADAGAQAEARLRRREEERGGHQREQEAAARAAEAEQRRATDRDARKAGRDAQRHVERAERRAAELEAEVARLQAELDDPTLYATAEGVQRAAAMARTLDERKVALDAALAEGAEAG